MLLNMKILKKMFFLTENGDTMRVTCHVFLKDISNFFKNLNMPLKFSEFNITLRLVDSNLCYRSSRHKSNISKC